MKGVEPTVATPSARPLRRFLRLAGGDFVSAQWRVACGVTVALLALTGLQILVQIRLNLWNRDFFNALENRDLDTFSHQTMLFVLLASAGMIVAVFLLHARQALQLEWRRWLVCHLQHRWLENGRHYRMGSSTAPSTIPINGLARMPAGPPRERWSS